MSPNSISGIIDYAGYGLFRDKEFGNKFFGKETRSQVAALRNYELVVLQRHELPQALQEDPNLPPDFRIYAVRRKKGSSVIVRIWQLTIRQKNAADIFNFENDLYQKGFGTAFTREDHPIPVSIDEITDPEIGIVTESMYYNPYLSDREKAIAAAEVFNREFIQKPPEGNHSQNPERR